MRAGKSFLVFALLSVVLAGSCTDQPSPSFSLHLAESAYAVVLGSEVVTEATVECRLGFAGAVALSLEAPDGVIGTFVPDTIVLDCTERSAYTQSMLTLEVGFGVQAGTHQVTVVGTSGDAVARATTTLTVTEPRYTLSGLPDEVVVTPPTTRELPVTIDRPDASSVALTFSLAGAPEGVSSSFDPNPCTTTATTLTLRVADTARPGTYPLTVRAESVDGFGDTLTFSLVVGSATQDRFDLLLDPASLTLKPGQQADVAVTIERTPGFTAPVALSAAVTPDAQHITVTFTPVMALDESVMTVAVGVNVPPRSYELLVQGLSDRLADDARLGLVVSGDAYATRAAPGGR